MNEKSFQIKRLDELMGEEPTFLAIGVFDGVHLGHQQLLKSMIAEADQRGARSAVLTFYPHPGKVISGQSGRLYLCSLDERIKMLADLGLSLVITQEFDHAFRMTRAADFIEELSRTVKMTQLWGGAFGLGYNREGDINFLRDRGKELGFTVHHYQAMVQWGDSWVSSSRVRQALRQGNLLEANGCLGHPYSLTGVVVPGDGRGKQLGIPTANLAIWDELILPSNGVYAAVATLEGQSYMAAVNVGYRPTVNGHSLNVEAHLLDFNQEIYGQALALDFKSRIRDEKKFDNLEALVAQIKKDLQQVRELLVVPVLD